MAAFTIVDRVTIGGTRILSKRAASDRLKDRRQKSILVVGNF